MEFDITKIKAITVVGSVLTAICIIPNGYLYFYIFNPEYFDKTDLIRLTILSIGVIYPIYFINFFFSSVIIQKFRTPTIPTDNLVHLPNFFGMFVTLFILDVPLLIRFIFQIQDQVTFYISLGLEILYLLAALTRPPAKI
jgi:hypothetical protein